jgi:hypothetical protein
MVEALLHQTNLWAFRKKALSTYSGGMKQRFGIAQALLGKPRLIIVDEPTAGLDPAERNRFLNLLSSIGRDITVILSTHIVEDVRELCPRMAIIAAGELLLEGAPQEALELLQGKMWSKVVVTDDELRALESELRRHLQPPDLRPARDSCLCRQLSRRWFPPCRRRPGRRLLPQPIQARPYLSRSTNPKEICAWPSFGSSFVFELKFRLKSLSTYVYFALWFLLSFLAIAAEDFISTGNGKQLLNGPFSTTILYTFFTLFGTIIIAAIFGTSSAARLPARHLPAHLHQAHHQVCLSRRPLGRILRHLRLCLLRHGPSEKWPARLRPWADHTRIASGHAWWYWQPFLFIVVIQIFFLGSLFFMVAALSRKIFIVYLQGVAVFMVYLIVSAVFSATRSLEHFWSGILDPVGLQLVDVLARYWTVAEKNTLLFSWSPHVSQGVFLYNRLLWSAVGVISLVIAIDSSPCRLNLLPPAHRAVLPPGQAAGGGRASRAVRWSPCSCLACTSTSEAGQASPNSSR